MVLDRIAGRYARALFEAAMDEGVVDEAGEALECIAQICAQMPLVVQTLEYQEVPLAQRYKLVDELESLTSAPAVVTNTIKLMVQKRRMDRIAVIAAIYRDYAARTQKHIIAVVHVADKHVVKEICARIQEIIADELKLRSYVTAVVEPALIGGVMLRIGDTVIDASVAGRLARMKEALLATGRVMRDA